MNVIIPAQTIQVPDPVDLASVNTRLSALESRVAALENHPVPTPVPTPTPVPVTGQLYKSDCIWNKKLADNAPLHPNNSAMLVEFTATRRQQDQTLNVGTPLYIVTNTDLKAPIYLTDANNAASPVGLELRQGINIPIRLVGSAVDSDKSCAIYNRDTDTEYNIWQLGFRNGRYEGVSAGILKNASQSDGTFQRYAYWNTVRATHIPIGAGLILKKELEAGVIPHALSMALSRASGSFVNPAKSSDGGFNGGIPEGTRFRFPANITINPNWTPLTKMMVIACRDYGVIVVDKTNWCDVIYMEGVEQYGLKTGDALKPYVGNHWTNESWGVSISMWEIFGTKTADAEFPWSQLQVLA